MKSILSTFLITCFVLCSFHTYAQLEEKESDASIMFKAIENDDMEALKEALNNGIKANARDDFQQTPLHRAATFGRLEAIEILIKSGADPNAKDRKGLTPLYQAYKANQFNAMKLLLEKDADVHATYDKERNTLLHYVAKGGDKKLAQAELLLEHGANPKAQNLSKKTPIDVAKDASKHDNIVKLMKDKRWKQ